MEKNNLVINPKIKKIYDYCISKNKRIIIESDMYLSKEFITQVLKDNNFYYDRLYLSSDIMKTKKSGSMFDYMLFYEKVNPSNVMHIGDSIRSDFIMSKKKKIKSLLFLKKKYKNNLLSKDFDNLIKDKSVLSDSVYNEIGFEYLGPLFLGFSNWLMKNLKSNNIDKVFFLSRDGFVMKKSFDLLCSDNINSKYLYVSRKGLIVPALYYFNSFEDMLELTNIEVLKNFTYDLFINKVGLTSEICKNELLQLNLTSDSVLYGDKLRNDEIFNLFYDLIKKGE